MSKLQVSAARTSYVDPCESIDIDNAMNTGAQTDKNMCVDQGVTFLKPTVTGEHLRFLYPSLYDAKLKLTILLALWMISLLIISLNI